MLIVSLETDDLFGDDIMEMPKKKSKVTIPIQSRSQYLDQDWQLSEEDEKDNKGSGKKDSENQTASQPEVIYPCFALMYRLRKEYMDTTIEVAIADHNSYCKNFKRLINSEIIILIREVS